MTRTILTLVTLACVISAPRRVDALCLPTPATGSALYQYVMVFIDGLSYAKEALRLTEEASAALGRNADMLTGSTDFMVGIKQAGEQYQCAAHILATHRTNNQEAIRLSAESAIFVYTMLPAVDRKLLDELRKVLDGEASGGQGTLSDRLSDLISQKRELWKMLPLASVSVTHALVVMPKDKDERLSRLALARGERQQLLHALERNFGPPVKQGLRAGHEAVVGAAAVLYGFIGDTKWRSLDAP